MNYSKFGARYAGKSGIVRLMEDISQAAGSEGMIMLGGGNPANIPETYRLYAPYIQALADSEERYQKSVECYSSNQGDRDFIHNLADMFRSEFDFDITPENIALTNGSQSTFFMLFNMFGGEYADGSFKKILFPIIPEYIGYEQSGLSDDMLVSHKPLISIDEKNREFKYQVDFDRLKITPDIAAICVSRPTNPTGNVITDEELTKLHQLSEQHRIPLIIDNAYGAPFPNIIYSDVRLFWQPNIIFCMSLSKLGFPSSRTGIVIARKEYIDVLSSMNAVINLAPPSLIAQVVSESINSREVLKLSNNVIRSHYREKAEYGLHIIKENLAGVDYFIHKPEGAIFLWLWMRNLPITSDELYERLKKRKVIIISGMNFFPGFAGEWQHTQECIRISIAADKEKLKAGLEIICDEIKEVYANAVQHKKAV